MTRRVSLVNKLITKFVNWIVGYNPIDEYPTSKMDQLCVCGHDLRSHSFGPGKPVSCGRVNCHCTKWNPFS